MTILDILKLGPVMPVIVIDSADQAEPLADALLAGGILTCLLYTSPSPRDG